MHIVSIRAESEAPRQSIGSVITVGLRLGLGSGLELRLWLGLGLELQIVVYKLLEKATKCGSIT